MKYIFCLCLSIFVKICYFSLIFYGGFVLYKCFMCVSKMKIVSAEFIKSVAKIDQCPDLNLPEFVFFGRSNVWKSSLINMLTQKKDLAKCSKIPWKTRLFNFFVINNSWVIVDLPWYGYAKAWNQEKKQRLDMAQEFLINRKSFKKTFLLVDGSIPPQKIDFEMMQCFVDENIDFSIIFTKLDKCNQKERSKNQKLFKEEMSKNWINSVEIFAVDNIKWKWREELLSFIESLI